MASASVMLLLAGLATVVATENVIKIPGSAKVNDASGKYNRVLMRERRVIGGRNARVREFPWMVSLHYDGAYLCSGFLVTPKFVMTAAHCVLSFRKLHDPKLYKGYVGTIRRDGPGKAITFNEIMSHSDFLSTLGQFDIALLKLATPVKLNRSIKPICLPTEDSSYEDLSVRIMGWGSTQKGSKKSSQILQTALERVHANSYCFDTYNKLNITLPFGKSICAGGAQDKGICHMDSGGPLVVMNENKPVAIGVASHGSRLGCAAKFVPAIFTATSLYTDWMKDKMGDDAKELCFLKITSTRTRRARRDTTANSLLK